MTDKKQTEKKEPSNLEKTLLRDDFKNIVATNLIKSDPAKYGTLDAGNAETAYEGLMKSEYVQETREKAYQAQKAEYAANNVAGEPTYMSNPEISALVIKQINEVMESSKLGDLYEVVKKVAPGLDFKIDGRIKNMTQKGLISALAEKKAFNEKGQIDPKKLTAEEASALNMYGILSEAYKEMNAKNFGTNSVTVQFNEAGNQINRTLNPEPEQLANAA